MVKSVEGQGSKVAYYLVSCHNVIRSLVIRHFFSHFFSLFIRRRFVFICHSQGSLVINFSQFSRWYFFLNFLNFWNLISFWIFEIWFFLKLQVSLLVNIICQDAGIGSWTWYQDAGIGSWTWGERKRINDINVKNSENVILACACTPVQQKNFLDYWKTLKT